jgi:hypothetical protein
VRAKAHAERLHGPLRVAAALLWGLWIGTFGCATSRSERPTGQSPGGGPGGLGTAGSALYLDGELRGPLPGWGPRVDLEIWLREDGWLRADLRAEAESGPTHEVLLWTPDVALLLDRREGRFTTLGDSAGVVDALSTGFRVEEAVWLALGIAVGDLARPGSWERVRSEWRYRADDRGLRRRDGTHGVRWTELVWRESSGQVHRLRADVRELEITPWGAVPRSLALEGTDLEGRALLDWRIQPIVALGDSVYDPLWEPSGR